ncbi:CbtA family protein [Natrialbaceae archaeon GCM10025810]|uniref:CbtA family protein n=1 Tax=Halovalidus salilacus TaxID=3075124 RepID=UPI0036207A15
MIQTYLERGVVAGVVAGVLYGLYVAVVANPIVGYMEGLGGHGHDHAHDHGHGHEAAHAVSETATAVVSVGSGVLWGILLGAAFALAFYVLEPALPGSRRVKGYVLAGAGFLTVSGVPWLVLPPAAPGAEQAYGPDVRLAIYAGLMLLGALVATAAVVAYRRTESRGTVPALVAGAVRVIAVVVVLPLAAPTITEPGAMPTDLVAGFRGLVVLSQAALWVVVAATFDRLLERADPTDDPARLEEELSVNV